MGESATSVVQIGKAINHTPISSLAPFTEQNGEANGKDSEERLSQTDILGGFIGKGSLVWRASKSTLEILDPKTSVRKAAWTFGAIVRSDSCIVTCVCGIGESKVSHVAVGVDLGEDRYPQGMVAVLSLASSKLVRVLPFQHKITSLCMVTGGELPVDPSTLNIHLQIFSSLIAVGTQHGNLYLADLALDCGEEVKSDEVSPASLITFTIPDADIKSKRIEALTHKFHPSLYLSEGMVNNGKFQLLGPDKSPLFETISEEVDVSALFYAPQLAALIVGYNFGAFQVFNLSTLIIDCTSPYEDNNPPIQYFTYQEPENDPRNFVYIWVCRCWPSTIELNKYSESRPVCTLYSMTYDKKEWIEGHGLWYQGLASISPRFEFDLLNAMRDEAVGFSLMFAASTVVGPTTATSPTPVAHTLSTSDDEIGVMPELSLCVFGWLGEVMREGRVDTIHYISVFDINQWYQSQMPGHLYIDDDALCPYMSFHELDKVPKGSVESTISATPIMSSWTRHTTRAKHNDTHWFPSALSYDIYLLTTDSIIQYQCNSVQRAALISLSDQGPIAILNPEVAYNTCVNVGLIQSDHNTSQTLAMAKQREALLSVALDQQLVTLLIQCVSEFCEGKFNNLGCSPTTLLDWAWSRLHQLKVTNDKLCEPLFDCSSAMLGQETISILHQNAASLSTLHAVLNSIKDFAYNITSIGAHEMKTRVKVVSLLQVHLESVLWFYHCGLLPQCSIDDVLDDNSVPFPAEILQQIYTTRRKEIKSLSSTMSGEDLLLIDGLILESNGELGELWSKEGGSNLYPPSSLHALLSIYLSTCIPLSTKHRIVQYLFLDLASLLSDDYCNVFEELVKFPSSFSLSPSLIKLTQAFWLLDHKDFPSALSVLLDPLVNKNDITPWQHQRIIKAFLYQKEEHSALVYTNVRKPPQVTVEDIRLHLTLLLANGLIREAFHYQQSHRIRTNTDDLLMHLFTACEQIGKLESLVSLPMTELEEKQFVKYLKSSQYGSALDLLVVYYLQRSRYSEAMELQDPNRGILASSKGRPAARSALIHGCLTHLPDSAINQYQPKSQINRITYNKPKPLSAYVRQNKPNPQSRSFFSQQHTPKLPSATPFRSKTERRLQYLHTHDPQSLKNPNDSKPLRDESLVVFPTHTPSGSPVRANGSAMTLDTNGNKTVINKELTLMLDTILTSHKMPDMSINTTNQDSELLSLLKTPKIVKRKSILPKKSSIDSSYIDTPQSILKVKKIIQRPLSPSTCSEISIMNNSLAKPIDNYEADVLDDVTAPMTPKQLRFHIPSPTDLTPVDMEASNDSNIPSSTTSPAKSPTPVMVPPVPALVKSLPGFVGELLNTSSQSEEAQPEQHAESAETSIEVEQTSNADTNQLKLNDSGGISENDSFYSAGDLSSLGRPSIDQSTIRRLSIDQGSVTQSSYDSVNKNSTLLVGEIVQKSVEIEQKNVELFEENTEDMETSEVEKQDFTKITETEDEVDNQNSNHSIEMSMETEGTPKRTDIKNVLIQEESDAESVSESVKPLLSQPEESIFICDSPMRSRPLLAESDSESICDSPMKSQSLTEIVSSTPDKTATPPFDGSFVERSVETQISFCDTPPKPRATDNILTKVLKSNFKAAEKVSAETPLTSNTSAIKVITETKTMSSINKSESISPLKFPTFSEDLEDTNESKQTTPVVIKKSITINSNTESKTVNTEVKLQSDENLSFSLPDSSSEEEIENEVGNSQKSIIKPTPVKTIAKSNKTAQNDTDDLKFTLPDSSDEEVEEEEKEDEKTKSSSPPKETVPDEIQKDTEEHKNISDLPEINKNISNSPEVIPPFILPTEEQSDENDNEAYVEEINASPTPVKEKSLETQLATPLKDKKIEKLQSSTPMIDSPTRRSRRINEKILQSTPSKNLTKTPQRQEKSVRTTPSRSVAKNKVADATIQETDVDTVKKSLHMKTLEPERDNSEESSEPTQSTEKEQENTKETNDVSTTKTPSISTRRRKTSEVNKADIGAIQTPSTPTRTRRRTSEVDPVHIAAAQTPSTPGRRRGKTIEVNPADLIAAEPSTPGRRRGKTIEIDPADIKAVETPSTPSRRRGKTIEVNPTDLNAVETPSTPSRRRGKTIEIDPADIKAVETPSTPSRRKGKTIEVNPADVTTAQASTPSRTRRKTIEINPIDVLTAETPSTPNRRRRTVEVDAADVMAAQNIEPSTPSRNQKKLNESSSNVGTPNKSRRRRTSDLNAADISAALQAIETPSTPGRTRRRKTAEVNEADVTAALDHTVGSSTDTQPKEISGDTSLVQELAKTPRRGRKSSRSEEAVTPSVKTTPSRRGRPSKTDNSEENIQSSNKRSLSSPGDDAAENEQGEETPKKRMKLSPSTEKTITEDLKSATPKPKQSSRKVPIGSPVVSDITPLRRSRRFGGSTDSLASLSEEPEISSAKKQTPSRAQRGKSGKLSNISDNLEPIQEIPEKEKLPLEELNTSTTKKKTPGRKTPSRRRSGRMSLINDTLEAISENPEEMNSPEASKDTRNTRQRKHSASSSVVSNLSPERISTLEEINNTPTTNKSKYTKKSSQTPKTNNQSITSENTQSAIKKETDDVPTPPLKLIPCNTKLRPRNHSEPFEKSLSAHFSRSTRSLGVTFPFDVDEAQDKSDSEHSSKKRPRNASTSEASEVEDNEDVFEAQKPTESSEPEIETPNISINLIKPQKTQRHRLSSLPNLQPSRRSSVRRSTKVWQIQNPEESEIIESEPIKQTKKKQRKTQILNESQVQSPAFEFSEPEPLSHERSPLRKSRREKRIPSKYSP